MRLRDAVWISMPVMPNGAVTHHIDAELVGGRELGAHGEAETVAELGRLTPAEIGAGTHRVPERQQVAHAGCPRIVGDDGVVAVEASFISSQISTRYWLMSIS